MQQSTHLLFFILFLQSSKCSPCLEVYQIVLCLLHSLLLRPYTNPAFDHSDCKMGLGYVISCIFMTQLWKEISHSLYDVGKGNKRRRNLRRGEPRRNKESEVTVPNIFWNTRKHTPPCVTFYYSKNMVYQIYGDIAAMHIVQLCEFPYRK
jgi:hypothetical protein